MMATTPDENIETQRDGAATEQTTASCPPDPSLLTLDQSFSTENIFISISGMIGAGKTTLAKALAERLGLPVYYEPVADNAYLEDFYRDKSRYGFPLQVYLLNRRFQQHQQIIWSGKGGVQDRTIYEDTVFAKVLKDEGSMEEREYETYRSLFSNMSTFMKKPNLIVHLDVSPEESLRRINLRSRGCESGIPLSYLQNLHAAYAEFLQDISRIVPVIQVDYSQFHSTDEMAEMVLREYATIRSVRRVESSSFSKVAPIEEATLTAAALKSHRKQQQASAAQTETVAL